MIAEKRIIVIDDDVEYCQEISAFLASLGAYVSPCSNTSEFFEKMETHKPDIALVDKNIGLEDGFDIIYGIRKHQLYSNLPIIMVSGEASDNDREEAIMIGADDILAKPLSLKNLEMRIIANLRRSQSYAASDKIICLGGVEINYSKLSMSIEKKEIPLTKTEYKIISELILKQGQIVNREQIASKFLSLNNSNTRTIDVHINSLRKKLGDYGKFLKTVRGRGYMFQMDS